MNEVSPTSSNNVTSPGSTWDDISNNLCEPDNEAPVTCDSKNRSPALEHAVNSSHAFDTKPSGRRMTIDEAVVASGNDAEVSENSSYAPQSLTSCTLSFLVLNGLNRSCMSLPPFTAPQDGDAVSSRSQAALEEVSVTFGNNAWNATSQNKSNHLDYSVLGSDVDRSQDTSRDYFKCETCEKSFMYFNLLTRHLRIHKAKSPTNNNGPVQKLANQSSPFCINTRILRTDPATEVLVLFIFHEKSY
ncbi:hypothetical protein MRX96_017351 [Rhipicephalus microplus]